MKFENINDLVEYVKSNHKPGQYIYRGQTQPWKLKSSLFRIEDNKEREKQWENTAHFCNWLLKNERLVDLKMNLDKGLAICQHHGYKTDLVDFSWDIEVAAYFATHGTIDEKVSGVIWAIEWESFKMIYDSLKKLDKPKLIEVKGLWRIENQKGLFLRDQGGSLLRIAGGPDLFFKQKEEYQTDTINTNFIYPLPNDLEKEIQRYKSIELSRNNRKNYPDWFKESNTLKWEHEVHSIEDHLKIIDWKNESKWIGINIDSYKSKDRKIKCKIEIHISNDGQSDISELRKHFDKLYRFDFEVDFETQNEIIKEEFNKRIREYTFALSQFPYTNAQIILSTKEYIELLYKSSIERLNKAYGNEIVKFFEEHYKEEVIEFGFSDNSGISSYCMIPMSYFENHKTVTKVSEQYEIFHDKPITIDKKIELFRLVPNFRKMMTEKEAIQFWSQFALPYQFLIRPKHSRIYIPHGINNFGYA